MHNHCLPHKSKLDAQLYRSGTQPHFCIAYVIGCKKIIQDEKVHNSTND